LLGKIREAERNVRKQNDASKERMLVWTFATIQDVMDLTGSAVPVGTPTLNAYMQQPSKVQR
jgi:hypothetical protein